MILNAIIAGENKGLNISNKPKITFDGSWKNWGIEIYDDKAYWEAWFFSSGTLTAEESYLVDAWGIGGGGATARSDGYNGAGSGYTNQVIGVNLPIGTTSIIIGAGAISKGDRDADGASTVFGSYLVCAGGKGNGAGGSGGGEYNYSESKTYKGGYDGSDGDDPPGTYNVSKGDGKPMRRFGDMTKDEYARPNKYTTSGCGWLNITGAVSDGTTEYGSTTIHMNRCGTGFGAGGFAENVYGSVGASGALVIRIPI